MRVTWRFLLTRICRARSPSVRATWILWPCGSRRSTSAATSPITAALPLMRLAHTRLCSGRGGGLSPARVVGSLRKRLSTTCWGVRFHAARMNTAATVAIFLRLAFCPLAVDGKGIPMIKPEGGQRAVRLTKGQKANRKKMATVAAVFIRAAWIRTPQQVVESLFRREPTTRAGESPPPRPEHKRVWASLIKGKAAVIGEVAAEVLRRDPQGHKIHVALTDGERALQILVSKNLQVTLILDLLHVLEKLWKAAYVFHAEGSTEAEQWVRLRAEKILEGHVSQVVQGIRQMVTKLALGGSKGKMLSSVANYLYRNRSRMHYDQYLARGLPIASGSVEGACKNLIKDRMERSGMRWTEAMAEAIVKLRAIYLSGDFDQYWPFHIQKDQERLHPAGRWSVVEK